MPTRLLLLALLFISPALADDYTRSIEDWRAARLARLTTPDGWLTLIGRHRLVPGPNTVGTAEDNSIRLAAGPPYLATITLEADRSVTLDPVSSALMEIDGLRVRSPARLDYRGEKPTRVTFGTASFHVMQRGEDLFLRVRDTQASTLRHFAGIEHFPIDPAWRIEAAWVPFNPPPQIDITNVIGITETVLVPGKAVFTHVGHTVGLLPIDEGNDLLFFVLTDLTAGEETYEASRFLYTPRPKDGKVILDFNKLQNPPCAFTEFSICPLPPAENRMPFPVRAGEKAYRGNR